MEATRRRAAPVPVLLLTLCVAAVGCGSAGFAGALRTLGAVLRDDPAAALLDAIGRIDRGVAAADTYYGAESERSGDAAARAEEYRAIVSAVLREVTRARASLDDDRPVTRERVDEALAPARREVEVLRGFVESLGAAPPAADGGAPRATRPPAEGAAGARSRADALASLAAAAAP